MFVVQLLAVTIYPIFIVPLFNTLKPLEAGSLKERKKIKQQPHAQ